MASRTRPVTFRERSGAGAPPTSASLPAGQLTGLACGGLGVRGREPRYAGVPAPASALPAMPMSGLRTRGTTRPRGIDQEQADVR
jgi:hypothetical protein